ncbi:MAG: acyl carrier protein [bacterium]
MDSDAKTPPTPSKAVIQSWLQRRIAESIEAGADEIETTLPFSYYGLDSVAAFEIVDELEIWLGRKLPQTLTWDYPNIDLLSSFLGEG